MNTNEMIKHIDAIKEQMAVCNNVMLSIVQAANVALPEGLTGINADAWNAQYKAHKKLNDYLLRIESNIGSALEYIKINLL